MTFSLSRVKLTEPGGVAFGVLDLELFWSLELGAWSFFPNMPKHRPSKTSSDLRTQLAKVKLLLCDVDGVLTDGTVLIGGNFEAKRFSILDGFGMRLLQREGIKVGWVSNRPSPATEQRAKELRIDFLEQPTGSKVEAVEAILHRAGLGWDEICFVGDDLVDLGVLKRAGFSAVVANGIDEAKAAADYVTQASGGAGAVREVAVMILKAQNKWKRVVQSFSA